MRQRVELITLGVPDLDAARRFYVDGLGWEPTLIVPGEVVFIQIGHGLMLGLFGAADLAEDIGAPLAGPPAPMSLAQVVETEQEVVQVIERARAIGAEILKEPQKAAFGGFHAYFADPAGFRWEIATNPGWIVGADGVVRLVPIESGE